MAEELPQQEMMPESDSMSDEEAILKIAQAMKDNAPTQEDKQNVHTFLFNVVQAADINQVVKVGNLNDGSDKNSIDELGKPSWTVRGSLEMARISEQIMSNPFFKTYLEASASETTSSSLSRGGFLVRQATTQTTAVADVTRRRKINKGMFGSRKIEETGGDPYAGTGNN